MITENEKKSANFLRIVTVLQMLRNNSIITGGEYDKAKKYYQSLTGSDLIILN